MTKMLYGVTLVLLICGSGSASAQTPMGGGFSDPITLTSPEMSLQPVPVQDLTMAAGGSPSQMVDESENPASMTNPSGILPLAIDGQFAFEPLPARGDVCNPRPIVSCLGPDYCGCHPRIYYGTNPCDDDPVLTMSPTVCDGKTTHWYQHAFRMVTRKKAVTEAIK
tara:strand:+ start:1277 stop:1774 length:498 start_codon:yes stop_codon:yes gene_type:complete